jgi:hypothetical protein
MEVEILKDAIQTSCEKTDIVPALARPGHKVYSGLLCEPDISVADSA